MANFQTVPVLDVHCENFTELWPTLLLAVKSSTFVALDMELSGLGDRKKLIAKSIDDRYSGMSEVAKTRSVLSIGLSCFKLKSANFGTCSDAEVHEDAGHQPTDAADKMTGIHFTVQTFNIIMLCSEDYIVEPLSLQFLVDHGFDFNQQYSKGIKYYRGNDKKEAATKQNMRQLMAELIRSQKPIVLHNAMVDLVFLYHHFYAALPTNLSSFVADMCEIFPGGIFDTKYMTEFQARFTASYLEYVFRKCQRDNSHAQSHGQPHVQLAFLSYPTTCHDVNYRPCGLQEGTEEQDGICKQKVCQQYGAWGWCKAGRSCPFSHDVDLILNAEDHVHAKRRRKRQNRNRKQMDRASNYGSNQENSEDTQINTDNEGDEKVADVSMETEDICSTDSAQGDNKTSVHPEESEKVHVQENPMKCSTIAPGIKSRTEGHRAGFDAFMTGFTFACFMAKFSNHKNNLSSLQPSDLGMGDDVNKIYLGGKDIPFMITKSSFAKTSKDHREKMETLKMNYS